MSEEHAALDLRAEIARIDRDREEARKFSAEQNKLTAEHSKLVAEMFKLYAEEAKLRRDRWIAPVTAAGAAIGSVIGAAAVVWRLLH
jgi:hypothetical protein